MLLQIHVHVCGQVWNHPWILKLDEQRKERQELRRKLFEEDSDSSFIVLDSPSSGEEETTSTTSTSVTKDLSRSSSVVSDGEDSRRGTVVRHHWVEGERTEL